MTAVLPHCETLLLELSGSTLHLTLNRPAVKNALNRQMWDELEQVFETIAPDRRIKTVVVRGAGGVFCAGGDISERSAIRDQAVDGEDPVAARNRRAGRILGKIDRAPQAVVAVVESHALGGGFGLACAADVVIAAENARFGLPEVTLGLAPAQIVPFLMRRIGPAELRRLALTAARVDAHEAYRIGLVHAVASGDASLEAELTQVLKQLDRAAPNALATAKEIIAMALRQEDEELLDNAASLLARMARSPEGVEGAQAFKEKRRPNWQSTESS